MKHGCLQHTNISLNEIHVPINEMNDPDDDLGHYLHNSIFLNVALVIRRKSGYSFAFRTIWHWCHFAQSKFMLSQIKRKSFQKMQKLEVRTYNLKDTNKPNQSTRCCQVATPESDFPKDNRVIKHYMHLRKENIRLHRTSIV